MTSSSENHKEIRSQGGKWSLMQGGSSHLLLSKKGVIFHEVGSWCGMFQVHHQPELETAEQRDFQKLKKSHSQGIWDLIEGQVAAQGLYNFLEEGCSRVGAGLFFQVTSHGTRGNYLKITKRITKHWNRAEVESSSLELFKKPLNVVLEDRV